MSSIKFTDNSKEVLKALGEQAETALQAIGAEAATYAMKDAPVDSGRLRNSIAWAIESKHSSSPASPAKPEDSAPKATPEEKTVYIGTNVEYAAAQEYGDYNHRVGKKHFLRDAMANHGDHYKAILEATLKS